MFNWGIFFFLENTGSYNTSKVCPLFEGSIQWNLEFSNLAVPILENSQNISAVGMIRKKSL